MKFSWFWYPNGTSGYSLALPAQDINKAVNGAGTSSSLEFNIRRRKTPKMTIFGRSGAGVGIGKGVRASAVRVSVGVGVGANRCRCGCGRVERTRVTRVEGR